MTDFELLQHINNVKNESKDLLEDLTIQRLYSYQERNKMLKKACDDMICEDEEDEITRANYIKIIATNDTFVEEVLKHKQ